MVLNRIPEERRTRFRKKASNYGTQHVPRITKHDTYQNASTRSASLTTAIANETFTSTSTSTDDTLSMISTPWSTETWRSKTESSSYSSSSHSWPNSLLSSYTTSVEPKTRTTTSGCPSIDVKTGSNLTVTLLDKVLLTPSVSRYVQPLNRQDSLSSPTFTSWSLETYTSTGVLSSITYDRLKVNYPWSPSTFRSFDLTDNYPSTPTLVSQKGSREGFGKFEPKKPFTPMNVVLSKDDHPLLDWILVKQQGIPVRK